MNHLALRAEFPRDAVDWRPQGKISSNGNMLALAYIDARDVMDRLDEVCGGDGWQDKYTETPSGRVICTISIKCGDEWVSKSDGAGSTQVEGEKGGISDAFKRAAVKWGIGRYLYSMPNVWVPVKTYKDKRTGEDKFKEFAVDPWTCVRGAQPRVQTQSTPPNATEHGKAVAWLEGAQSYAELDRRWNKISEDRPHIAGMQIVKDAFTEAAKRFSPNDEAAA